MQDADFLCKRDFLSKAPDQDRSLRPRNTWRPLLPGGGTTPSGPGRSELSLQQAGVMVMLPGLRGRNLITRVLGWSFSSRPRIRPEIALHLPVNFLWPLFYSPPVLAVYPFLTEAQRALFASDGYDGYDT